MVNRHVFHKEAPLPLRFSHAVFLPPAFDTDSTVHSCSAAEGMNELSVWRVDTVPYSMECAVWLLYEWTWQPAVVIGCEESDDWWLQIYSRLRCHCRLSWLPPLKALLHVYMYLCEYWGKKCVTQRERECVWAAECESVLVVLGYMCLSKGD